jgi:glycosyltransferase involved in cell wall biosynthesis
MDIVIPIHNALEDLKECLATVQQHTSNYRLILVDDCSQDDVQDFLREFGRTNKECIVIRGNKQRWFSRNSNLGLRLVRTSPCILLNSDCVVGQGWIEELLWCWQDAEKQSPGCKIGLVGSVQSDPEPRRYAFIKEPGYVTGHCLLMNIHAISEVSSRRGMPGWYFDEQRQDAIHIRSDMFMSYDLNRAGYSTIASYKALVGHKGFKSWNADLFRVAGLRLQEVND